MTSVTPRAPGLLGALRRDRRLAAIAGSIVGSQLVASVIGVAYWMLAARGLAPARLGSLGAATAAMSLLGALGMMGLGPLLIGELPRTPAERRWTLFAVAVVAAATLGAVLGAGFGAVASRTGATWACLDPAGAGYPWFVLGTSLTAVAAVLDQTMLVIGNPVTQVLRNLVASTWKLSVLAVALWLSRVGVTVGLAAWASGLGVGTVLAVTAAARQIPGPRRVTRRAVASAVRTHARTALAQQGVSLALSASSMLMPALIAWVVSPYENGIYTSVRLVASIAFLLPYALSVSLFAASSGDAQYDSARARRVLLTATVISLTLYAGMFFFGHLGLLLFGGRYADAGVPYLRVMGLAGPLLVFKDQFIARAQLRRRVRSIVHLVIAAAGLEIGGAVIGAVHGRLLGALCGWLAALAVEAAYAAPRLEWRVPPPRTVDLLTSAPAARASVTSCGRSSCLERPGFLNGVQQPVMEARRVHRDGGVGVRPDRPGRRPGGGGPRPQS